MYKNWDPDQVALLPVDPRGWLPADHLAYQIRDVTELIDTRPVQTWNGETRGAPGFDPGMVLSIILYAMVLNVSSSRKTARLCRVDLGARFLCGNGPPPKYRVFAKFRQEHGEALAGLLAQTVRLCKEAGLVQVSDRFLDGTKIKANAGLRRSKTYASICKKIDNLDSIIQDVLEQIAEQDAREDAEFGEDGDGLRPAERAESDRQTAIERRAVLVRAKEELEKRALADRKEHMAKPPSERTHHKAPTGKPEPDDRINMTDPESQIMTTHEKGYVQAYNAQAVVEPTNLIVTDAFLTNEANDYAQLEPAPAGIAAQSGAADFSRTCLAADAGYRSVKNLKAAADAEVEVFIPARRENRSGTFVAQPLPADAAEYDLNKAMDAKPATQAGHDFYAKRKCVSEPVFAMIKGCPGSFGLRQFLRRGLDKCQKDWLLTCAVHNLRRYFAALAPKPQPQGVRTPKCRQFKPMRLELAL
jgi:transposase